MSDGDADAGSPPASIPSESATTPSVLPTTPSATPTPDPWIGYFEDEARDNPTDIPTLFWGSFGDVDQVAVNKTTHESLEPGPYVVEIRCAGPERIVATVETPDGTPLVDDAEVACPGAVTLPVDLAEPGMSVTLDSEGETGAYLVGISPS
ncbi:hypothetical protein SAMN04487847_3054 [Microbacterium sp. cf332]|nr:hypothetical protein SAMN04487847_3054 [Microbacterium sp. cf332]